MAGGSMHLPALHGYDPAMRKSFMAVFVFAAVPVLHMLACQAQGRIDSGFTAIQIQAADRDSQKAGLLKKLIRQLAEATSPANAGILAGTIRKLWRDSSSASVRLLMERAAILIAEHEQKPALGILDSIVEIAPDYGEGWFMRAVLLFQMNELGRAMHDVGQALDLNPSHFDALRQLGLILNRLGDQKGALNAYQRAEKLYPLLPGIQDAIKELKTQIEGEAI